MSKLAAPLVLISAAALSMAQTGVQPDPSGLAAGVLSEANLARQAVRDRDQNSALTHVRQAQTLAGQLRSQLAGQPEPLLVPVRRVVETTTTYTDVKHKNGEMSADRLKRNSHISEVEQQTTADALNVTTAVSNLDGAQSALQKLDWTAADADLANVTNLVHTAPSDRQVPLLEAHQNLLLARARIVEQNYKAAAAPLHEAERALADFERQGNGSLSQQAEDMRQNINTMARHLNGASVDQIDTWIKTIEQWQDLSKHPLQPPSPK